MISLHRRKARASEGPPDLCFPMFMARWPPNTGQRKLKSLVALPKTPGGPPMAAGPTSRSSGRHPGALQSPPGALTRLPRGSPPASCLPCANNKQGLTSRQSPASSPSPAVTSQQHYGIKRRGPAAGGRRPLNPATEPFRAKGTAVAKRDAREGAAALLSPSQVNLFTQGLPPGHASSRWPYVFVGAVAILVF